LDLTAIFGGGYRISDAEEMSLTANQGREEMEQAKFAWKTDTADAASTSPRAPMTKDLQITLRPMEVKTYLVSFTHADPDAQSIELVIGFEDLKACCRLWQLVDGEGGRTGVVTPKASSQLSRLCSWELGQVGVVELAMGLQDSKASCQLGQLCDGELG